MSDPLGDSLEWLRKLHDADRRALDRVQGALPTIARAADAIAARLDGGGRWLYAGAGTSGRLAALDAAELPPTFGTDPGLVVALVAGGAQALGASREGAEDDEGAAARDLDAAGLGAKDVVVGVAASGATPYVLAALRHGRARGALTVAICGATSAPAAALAEIAVVVDVGPEALAGSTRLAAATAQKCVLSGLSTAVMAKRGLVYRGEMVAMRPTNAKLRRRAQRIVKDLCGRSDDEARALLESARWELPVALLLGKHGGSVEQARARLARARGSVARAMEEAS